MQIIYIYAFSRCFNPKRLTLHSGYNYYLYQFVCSLGIEPTTFCAANAMLYHWATGTQLHIGILGMWRDLVARDLARTWWYPCETFCSVYIRAAPLIFKKIVILQTPTQSFSWMTTWHEQIVALTNAANVFAVWKYLKLSKKDAKLIASTKHRLRDCLALHLMSPMRRGRVGDAG